MATEWVMIRVSRTTHARLTALRDRIERAYQEGSRRKPLPVGERDVFSLDAMIAELIAMKEDHLSRGNRRRRDRPIRYQG